MYHKPVLLEESIIGLKINPNGIYVDATFGGGGHSKEILNNLNSKGRLIAFDQDQDAIENRLLDKRLNLVKSNFKYLNNYLNYFQINKIDGLLADFGISSHQIDNESRGFSTRFDSDLDMRMNKSQKTDAKEVVNNFKTDQLEYIFKNYGELKRFNFIINSFPLEYEKLLPLEKKLLTESNPPNFKVKFFKEQENINKINCYSNELDNWERSNTTFHDNILTIKFRGPFKPRRGRINCSLNDNGKWRWFGIQFPVK